MFATGQFGYNVKRDINLSASKYFNQQLLNYSQKLSGDSDCIFFAYAVLQRIQLNSQIKIAIRKVSSDILTVGMLSRDFKETLRQVYNGNGQTAWNPNFFSSHFLVKT